MHSATADILLKAAIAILESDKPEDLDNHVEARYRAYETELMHSLPSPTPELERAIAERLFTVRNELRRIGFVF